MKILGFLCIIPALIQSQQILFDSTNSIPIKSSSLSLVDLLSSSKNHTLLLSAFQRARLIPLLNRLNGSTLFAPTDEAIKLESKREKSKGLLISESIWTYVTNSEEAWDEQQEREGAGLIAGSAIRDNLQLALRDTLLYHILNYTLFPAPEPIPLPPPSNDTTQSNSHSFKFSPLLPLNSITLQETLYLPSLHPYDKSFPSPPTLPGSPPDDPDPDGPAQNRTKSDGLLRGEGQRLRIVRREVEKKNKKGEKEIWLGVDWKGVGGAKVLGDSERYARNGAMVEIDRVLIKPVDLATQIRTNPDLSTFASLLPTTILDYLSTAPHLTLFAPTNEAWGSLSDLEMRYLRSGFAETDLTEIFGEGASKEGAGDGKVGYLSSLLTGNESTIAVSTILGGSLVVSETDEGVEVNGTRIETGDILSKNGVLHTVPHLLLPSGSLALTAEKYLIALNATRFVSLLRSVNLSHYVQIPTDQPSTLKKTSYTILAPKDEVLTSSSSSSFGSNWRWWNSLPEAGSQALKEVLEYHIVSGKWTFEEFEDGMLVGTELRSKGLKGGRQQLAVSVHSGDDSFIITGEDFVKVKDEGRKKKGIVGFGGASVIGDPVEVGDSIIYLLSSVLEPPTSVITTAVSDLRLSTFVASIYAASLDKVFSSAPGITYLVPENNAFTQLGLVMSYLLLPIAREELQSVLRYHALDEIVYLDEFPIGGGSRRYPTLDGAEIYLERSTSSNSTLTIHGPTIGGSPVNGETRDARLIEGDILTSTGALQIIDQVELPPHLDIGISKLMKGAKASTMADLIRAANMNWVLEGRAPPASFLDGTDGLEALGEGGRKKRRERRREEKRKAKANRAYTVLCPTDKALSRLNLTYYLSDPAALTELVKLHIIPTDAFAPLSTDGKPITLLDEITYPTLLDQSEGGESKYGSVAFRKWGDEGWMVGIKSARGTNGLSDSARVVAYGRSTPWFIPDEVPGGGGGDDDDNDSDDGKALNRFATGGVRLAGGGGVLTIDSVLLPYQPGWFVKYGWIIGMVVLGIIVASLVGLMGWKVWKGKKIAYERLEGEED